MRKIYYITTNLIDKIIRVACFILFKTKDNYIMFESERDFSDNARVLYEYISNDEKYSNYKLIWIVDDPKLYPKKDNTVFISRNKNSIFKKLKFYKILSNTKTFFFTHYHWFTYSKKNQTVVNLWHGTPLKDGGLDISDSFDYFVGPSTGTIDLYKKFVGVKEEQYVVLGMPRNDLLFQKNDSAKKIIKKKYSKAIMMMTTYKQTNTRTDSDYEDKYSIPCVTNEKELKKLNEILKEKSIFLLIKIHHIQKENIKKVKKMSNIIYLTDQDLENKNVLLYNLLGCMDALITDYSSVYFDYILLDRPIGFFVNDYESYKKNRGFLIENLFDYMPGPKMVTLKEFIKFINDLSNGKDGYKKERKRIRAFANKYCDDKSSERIANKFLK